MMPRRNNTLVLAVLGAAAFVALLCISITQGADGSRFLPSSYQDAASLHLDEGILHGENKATKIENATLKAELGHAAWKVLHTMMAKFPDKPTEDDSTALKSYIHLFARLYPCGDCARHFQKILKKFPPQVTSRSTAAAWACHVHNEVNKRLKKELFDCSNIGDFYDCGCADEEKPEGTEEDGFTKLELEKEGLTRGG